MNTISIAGDFMKRDPYSQRARAEGGKTLFRTALKSNGTKELLYVQSLSG